MNYYQINLEILKNKNEALYEKILKFEDKPYEQSFFIEKSKSGLNTLYYLKDNRKNYLHSPYDPLIEAKRWAQKVDLVKDSIVLIFGCGLGYHIREIINNIKHKEQQMEDDLNIKIFVVEPSMEGFMAVLKNSDYSDILKEENVFILVEECPDLIIKKVSYFLNPYTPEKVNFYEFASIVNIFRDYFQEISKFLFDFLNSAFINLNTTMFFSRLWTENLFKNIPYIISSPDISLLFDKFKDIPVIIVSAGPSLDKNVELLKEAKGKALIICVGTALKALLRRNIEPDLVISIDGAEANFRHFDGIDYDLSEIPLIFEFMIYHKILDVYKGPRIVFTCRHFMSDWVEKNLERDVGYLKVGGSVACFAFDFARRILGNPIVFIGQDLAFSHGRTHASGTVYEKDKISESNSKLIKVKDIYGNDIYTNHSMYTFLKWFEREIKNSDSNIKFIDATEGGAKIEGTEVMTLRDVIDKYCIKDYPIRDMVFSVFKDFEKPSIAIINNFIDSLKELSEQVENLKRTAKRGVRYSEQLYKMYECGQIESKKINKILFKLDKIDSELKSSNAKEAISIAVQPVIKLIFVSFNTNESNRDKREFGKLIARKSELLYRGIFEQSEFVLNLVNECIIKLEDLRKGLIC